MLRLSRRAPSIFSLTLFGLLCAVPTASRAQGAIAPLSSLSDPATCRALGLRQEFEERQNEAAATHAQPTTPLTLPDCPESPAPATQNSSAAAAPSNTPPDNPTSSAATLAPASDEGSAIVNTPSKAADAPGQSDQAAPAAPAPAPAVTFVVRQGSDACAEALRRATARQQQAAAATHTTPEPLMLPPECGAPLSPRPAPK